MLDPRDRAYVDSVPDPELRAVMVCALTTYRQADTLAVGDRAPSVVLTDLESGRPVGLDDSPRDRPLVLFFGSYT